MAKTAHANRKATQEELHRARWSEFVGASRPTVVPGAVVSREILAKCWLFTYNDAGE